MIEKARLALENVRAAMMDEPRRIRLQFIWVYCAMAAISFFMTAVNVATGKTVLMLSTLAFGLLCCVNIILAERGGKALSVSSWIFSAEYIALLTFFVVSGTPEGFSAIWACMLPASGLLLFRRKRGSALCALMFVILVFFLDTPLGNSFLQYPYTASFKLRFPMLFTAFFAVSFLLETVRAMTFDEMRKAREKYEYLYRHDALTELYNRYGFNERMDGLLNGENKGPVTLMILDLDYFKQVNDSYGHPFGDVVLKKTADILVKTAGAGADVCRWGGEEFAIMLSGERDAEQRGRDILSALCEMPIQTDGGVINISASMGVASADSAEGLEPGAFVRMADACLYAAKENGRNGLVCRKMLRE